jgi:hypothetical protein
MLEIVNGRKYDLWMIFPSLKQYAGNENWGGRVSG